MDKEYDYMIKSIDKRTAEIRQLLTGDVISTYLVGYYTGFLQALEESKKMIVSVWKEKSN